MQVPREPRFRPVQMLDEWPLSRPQRPQGPAQQDHIKSLIYGGGEEQQQQQQQQQKQQSASTTAANILGRRDPNQQSDPIQADREHPWNRCGIKKLEPNHRPDHAVGKKVIHAHHNNFANANANGDGIVGNSSNTVNEAPWNHPESMTALEKKYATYDYQNQQQQQRPSSSSCASIARRRAQQQAQASNWFTLTKESPFVEQEKQQQQQQDQEQQQQQYMNQQQQQQREFFVDQHQRPRPPVGEPAHLPNYSSTGPRLNSSGKLIQLMRVLAQTTQRCNSALWQSCLEGNILRKPFSAAPTVHATKQEKEFATSEQQLQQQDGFFSSGRSSTSQASSSAMMNVGGSYGNNNQRLRRSVPLYELAIQLEAALGQEISEKALCDVLGFGVDCTNDNTPVRYEHFVRLFNA